MPAKCLRIVLAAFVVVMGCDSANNDTAPLAFAPPDREAGFEATFAGIEFVWIPPGQFVMGADPGPRSTSGDQGPAHDVEIPRGFWLSKYEITQVQWGAVMESNPSQFEGEHMPVDSVSWYKCQAFCETLTEEHGDVYRLPSEAEWEYACRAGTTTKYGFGDEDSLLGAYAWHIGNSEEGPKPVGQRKPNAWGLYDMHGNVMEWCLDIYMGYPKEMTDNPIVDPLVGPQPGLFERIFGWDHVLRGGAYNWMDGCHSAYRTYFGPKQALPYMGIRIVREASPGDESLG